MKLDNLELYTLLKSVGVSKLYHANTVLTTITFLQQNGLLSRGAIEVRKLLQSYQSSDYKDKKFGVWNDIFLDTRDLHSHFKRQNLYGPIMFELSLELIKDTNLDIWITKSNPIHWNDDTCYSDKYFTSNQTVFQEWNNIDLQRKMITIRNSFEPILFEYIDRITIDIPASSAIKNHSCYNLIIKAEDKIKDIISTSHTLSSKINTRICSNSCYCSQNYLDKGYAYIHKMYSY